MATIGFVGLGLMGTGFTKRLRASGHDVVGYDLDPEKLGAAAEWGVEAAGSPAEAAERADIVAICVTTTKAVREVALGEGGLVAANGPRDKVVVDFSTTEMETTKQVAEGLRKADVTFLDSPVSGGPGAAETGTLALMVGGEPAGLDRALPVLETLGRVTHMGPTGAGQATKLVNQVLVLTNYCIAAEALRLAHAYGVDAAKIPYALEPGHANSAILQAVYPRMVEGDFAPRGYARQILKDLEMLHEATREAHLALPMTATATTLYRMLVAQGKGELDGAAIVTLLPQPDTGH